jgi:hypothetical protein
VVTPWSSAAAEQRPPDHLPWEILVLALSAGSHLRRMITQGRWSENINFLEPATVAVTS